MGSAAEQAAMPEGSTNGGMVVKTALHHRRGRFHRWMRIVPRPSTRRHKRAQDLGWIVSVPPSQVGGHRLTRHPPLRQGRCGIERSGLRTDLAHIAVAQAAEGRRLIREILPARGLFGMAARLVPACIMVRAWALNDGGVAACLVYFFFLLTNVGGPNSRFRHGPFIGMLGPRTHEVESCSPELPHPPQGGLEREFPDNHHFHAAWG